MSFTRREGATPAPSVPDHILRRVRLAESPQVAFPAEREDPTRTVPTHRAEQIPRIQSHPLHEGVPVLVLSGARCMLLDQLKIDSTIRTKPVGVRGTRCGVGRTEKEGVSLYDMKGDVDTHTATAPVPHLAASPFKVRIVRGYLPQTRWPRFNSIGLWPWCNIYPNLREKHQGRRFFWGNPLRDS